MSLTRFALLAMLLAGPVAAQDALPDGTPLRAQDAERLNNLDATAGQALRQAMAGGDPADLRVLTEVMQGNAMPPELALASLPGEWNCRMIKLGGNLPIVVYQPFRCRAGADGSFEKLTGSQRTTGQATLWAGLPVYVGTAFVQDSTPPRYADLPEGEPADPGVMSPDVGVIEMTGAHSGRILFPAPYVES
ncbi:MAG: DUF4893 domain-containing protein, partial [Paracoccus sp. (in: a-proteobacteria)]|nr:DUF4893 domain-containing protein [Paracoccus sp. (in: a-proteobacteria)]